MEYKKLHLSLLLLFVSTLMNAQQIFTYANYTSEGVPYNKIYLKYADDSKTCLMVIAAPKDSVQYYGDVEIPDSVEITDTTSWWNPITRIRIDSIFRAPIVKIDNNAFKDNQRIKSVFISPSIKEVGTYAFSGCSNLSKSVFTSIEQLANTLFGNESANPLYLSKHLYIGDRLNVNSEIKVLHIPETIITINKYAFAGCENLDSVYIPSSVRYIGSKAFLNCKNIKKCRFKSMKDLFRISFTDKDSNPLFYGHHLYTDEEPLEVTSISIPTGTNIISNAAFAGCSEITKVTISEEELSIGSDAFLDCKNIYTVDYPSLAALTTIRYGNENSNPTRYAKIFLVNGDEQYSIIIDKDINDYAFYNAKWLEIVTIKNGVKTIGACAFSGCSNLEQVIFDNAEVDTIKHDAFNSCSKLSSIRLPSSLKWMGYAVFRNCWQIHDIEIPESTTHLEYETFWGCNQLDSVTINANITSIPERMFKGCSSLKKFKLSKNTRTIDEEAFSGCTKLEALPEGSSITTIKSNAFTNCGFEELKLPTTVTLIGKQAFYNCKNLKNLFIPKEISGLSIGRESFASNSLENIFAYPTIAPNADESAFGDNLQNINLFYEISGTGYEEKPWSNFRRLNFSVKKIIYFVNNDSIGCDSILVGEKITLRPDSIKEDWDFTGWIEKENTPSIMPDYDLYIHGYFTTRTNIDGLTYFIDPTNNVIKVEADIDAYKNLTDVNVPDSIIFDTKKYRVTAIEAQAFMNCKNLQEVIISDSLRQIGKSAFSGCTDLTSITLPKNIELIADSLFSDCKGLVNVSLPKDIKHIGKSAFYGCI